MHCGVSYQIKISVVFRSAHMFMRDTSHSIVLWYPILKRKFFFGLLERTRAGKNIQILIEWKVVWRRKGRTTPTGGIFGDGMASPLMGTAKVVMEGQELIYCQWLMCFSNIGYKSWRHSPTKYWSIWIPSQSLKDIQSYLEWRVDWLITFIN